MVVRGSTLVAKVEEALQHRTRTIDFTLTAIIKHARVLRRSRSSRATKRSVAVAVLRTYTIKVCTQTNTTFKQSYKLLHHESGLVMAQVRVGVGLGPHPRCVDSGFINAR